MAINFIINDPNATSAASSTAVAIKPSKDRPNARSGVAVSGLPPQALYQTNTTEFVAWQAREAALRAIVAVEAAFGPLPGWSGRPQNRLLPLVPVEGTDLNAYYDRESVSFFVTNIAGQDVFSGASTDVVAHEVGHAILDAIRPDLWGVNMMEADAFHEGFGDIVAIHTALSDAGTRALLLTQGLDQPNFVEATAEELSAAIGAVYGANHPASAPRRALNTHRWSFPQSLPISGPPHILINESHSLGQLASGIYYDLVCQFYSAATLQGEAALLTASNAAMKLVMQAAKAAAIRPRFFEGWGRAMASLGTADQLPAIISAFGQHGIIVSPQPKPSPRVRLANQRSSAKRSKSLLTTTAKSNLRSAMGFAAGERMSERELEFEGETLLEVSGTRKVDLTGLAEGLADVRATVSQPALVGEVDAAPALMGAIDSEFALSEEVRAYVATLVAHHAIAWGGRQSAQASKRSMVVGTGITHAIVTKGGEKFLERRKFACGCRGNHTSS